MLATNTCGTEPRIVMLSGANDLLVTTTFASLNMVGFIASRAAVQREPF
jgi:hypothetical protein